MYVLYMYDYRAGATYFYPDFRYLEMQSRFLAVLFPSNMRSVIRMKKILYRYSN